MCAIKTCSAAIDIPAARFERRNRFTTIEVMIALVEAFQEALDMRRAMLRNDLLNDE